MFEIEARKTKYFKILSSIKFKTLFINIQFLIIYRTLDVKKVQNTMKNITLSYFIK